MFEVRLAVERADLHLSFQSGAVLIVVKLARFLVVGRSALPRLGHLTLGEHIGLELLRPELRT